MKNSARQISEALRNILALTAIAISATACASDDSSDAGLGDPSVVTKLQDMARQASSSSGASSTLKMYAVAVSDHQTAETALGGATIYDHAPVFVIVVTGGTFTARGAPAGADLPEGTVLTITVNAATYDVTDVGIGNVEPDLSDVASARVELSAR